MRHSSSAGALLIGCVLFVASSPALQAQDLSVYRQFRLGMTVAEATAAIAVPETAAEVVHTRPLLIQELQWHLSRFPSAAESESVRTILLNFCDKELFRIVVEYREARVEGLTEADLVEAISAAYGPATWPVSQIIISSMAQDWTDAERVLARWEDEHVSINLFRPPYPSTFGLVIYSKRVAPLARAAIGKALLIEEAEAPARAVAAQQAREDAEAAKHAKARAANKVAFKF